MLFRVKKTEDGCWEWQSGRVPDGYGDLSVDGKHYSAHRLAWELWNGAVPAGLCVLHTCDNPPCVNPAHLWLGTKSDNLQDAYDKGRR